MLANSLHVVAHALLLIADGKPLDVFSCARSGAFPDILKSLIGEGCRFQAVGQQSCPERSGGRMPLGERGAGKGAAALVPPQR